MEAEAPPPPKLSPSKEGNEESFFQSPSQSCCPNLVGAALSNNGNTCFLNSVLQCITHTVPVVEKIRSENHPSPCSRGKDGFCTFCALRSHIDECISKSGYVISPEHFTDNLSKISSDFRLGQQEDAHEFLRCLLDSLDRCCHELGSKDQPPSTEKCSLVSQVFGGRLVSQLQCCECGHCTNTHEDMLDLSLGIDDVNTLTDALESFTKVEKIEDPEIKLTCEGCNAQVSKEKQLKIDQAPAVVSLQLKRFDHTGQFTNKIDKFVEYPLELDLRPYLSSPKDKEQTKYDLYAVMVHIGSVYSGHYYSMVRSSPTAWYKMDDCKVGRVSETNVLQQTAYVLFYIKQGLAPWFSSLLEAEKMVDNSPTSVLNHMDHIFSPDSVAEPSCSSSGGTSEKDEGNDFSMDPSPESTMDLPKRDHSLSTPQKFNYRSQENRVDNALMGCTLQRKRPNSDHHVMDIFHNGPLEDKEESQLIPQAHKRSKGNSEVMKTGVKDLDESLRGLVRGMPSSRRFAMLSCLPSTDKSQVKSSDKHPLPTRSQQPFEKRQRFLDAHPSDAKKSSHQRCRIEPRSGPASSQNLSPRSIKRSLFVDDSAMEFEVDFD